MYRAYLSDLLRFLDGVATLRSINDGPPNDFDSQRDQLEGFLKQIGGFAVELEFESTPSRIQFAVEDIKTMSQAEFSQALKEIDRHIRRDIHIVALSVVPKAKRQYFYKDFLKHLEAKFPKATAELREAGACFALGRNTATVFHSVRAAEYAVKALARAAGVIGNIEFKEWGKVLNSIDQKVKPIELWRTGAEKSNALEFYGDALSFARGLKDAHRNIWLHLREDRELAIESDAMKAFFRSLELVLLCQTRITENQKRALPKRSFSKSASSLAAKPGAAV